MRNLLALSVLAVSAASQAIMLDDFSDGNFSETHTTTTLVTTTMAATVPGGVRGVENSITDNPFRLNSTVAVSSGVFSHSTDPLVDAASLIGYGYTSLGSSDLNLDLSGDSAFTVDVVYNDVHADIGMFMFSSTYGSSSAIAKSVDAVAFGSPVTLTFDFSEFGVARDDVDAFALVINGVPSNDIILDNFQTAVPEPATMVFGFAALAALAAKRRKQA